VRGCVVWGVGCARGIRVFISKRRRFAVRRTVFKQGHKWIAYGETAGLSKQVFFLHTFASLASAQRCGEIASPDIRNMQNHTLTKHTM
jgi:hypothetical protein